MGQECACICYVHMVSGEAPCCVWLHLATTETMGSSNKLAKSMFRLDIIFSFIFTFVTHPWCISTRQGAMLRYEFQVNDLIIKHLNVASFNNVKNHTTAL